MLYFLKKLNPLTAKVAKGLREDRKELEINILPLRTLRLIRALCG